MIEQMVLKDMPVGSVPVEGFTFVGKGVGGVDHVHTFKLGVVPETGRVFGWTVMQDVGEAHQHFIDLRSGESLVTSGSSRGLAHSHGFTLFKLPIQAPQALNPVQIRSMADFFEEGAKAEALARKSLKDACGIMTADELISAAVEVAKDAEKQTLALKPASGFFTVVMGEAVTAGDEAPKRLGPPTPQDIDKFAVIGKDMTKLLGTFRAWSEPRAIANAQATMKNSGETIAHLGKAIGRLDGMPFFRMVITLEVTE